MVNRKRKSLVTIVLVVGLMLSSISMVFAALETFLVQGNDGCYYEYNSSDLDMSYLTYQINPNLPGATMYKHFISVGEMFEAGGDQAALTLDGENNSNILFLLMFYIHHNQKY